MDSLKALVNIFEIKTTYIATTFFFLTAILAVMTFGFHIHPGYQVESTSENLTLSKHTLFTKDHIDIAITSENEIKIAILKYYISQVNSIWMISIFVLPAMLLILLSAFKHKQKLLFLTSLILLIILLPLVGFILIKNLNVIEKELIYLLKSL